MRVFLTGASSGLGEALARHYAAGGATLGLFARRESELARLAEALAPATVAVYAGDVRDADALARAAADFIDRFGAPDVVIANAGISRGALTDEPGDLPAFRAILETNVLGIVHTFSPFMAALRAADRGTLVGVSRVAGFRGLPGSGAYSGSKAAAIAYLESLRVELHGTGISVVTICPGFVATPLTERNPYPMPFLLQPDKAARLMARAIARRRRFYVLPWQMALLGKVLRVAPRALYDRVFAGRKRKPRHAE
ncbi:MAG: SDR family oxidoreductase [Burkholderiales bacterium]